VLGSAVSRVVKKNALLGVKEIFTEALEGMKPSVRAVPLREWIAEGKALASSLKTNPLQRQDVGTAVATSAWNTFADLNLGGPTGADMPWSIWQSTEAGDNLDGVVDGAFYGQSAFGRGR